MNKKVEGLNITSLGRVERMINKIKKDNPLIADWDKYELSFEFVCSALFPSCWKNVQKALADEHFAGYLEGKNEAEGNK